MTYAEWCEVFGKNRWRHEDGTGRTIYPLDYNWATIYDEVCKEVDQYFMYYDIPCNELLFRSRFYSLIPTAWLAYKTELEFFSGTLDGYTIDPNTFEAGYHKTTKTFESVDSESNSQSSGETTETSQADGSSNSRGRSIAYQQGDQAFKGTNAPTNDNIGELGVDYASGFSDSVTLSETTSDGKANSTSKSNTGGNTNASRTFSEDVLQTNINYYDNLAFLRERADHMKLLKPFYKYFEHLFADVTSFRPAYLR